MAHGSTSITAWFAKVALVVLVLGVLGEDAISTFSADISLSDDANAAAAAGRSAVTSGGGYTGAEEAAVAYASAHHERITPDSLRIAPDGTVTLQLERHVDTWVVGKIPWVKQVVDLSAQGASNPVP